MGASPKKKSTIPVQGNAGYMVKLSITIVICFTIYFVTRPSTNADLSSSTGMSTTAGSGGGQSRAKKNLGFWSKPSRGEFTPEIAWLMSFPNSGTSFTMTCVEHTSNFSTASNYGDEVTKKGDYSLPIYPRYPEGPFWEGLSGKLGAIRLLPDQYVLVKTHCGSRCIKCPPSDYVETFDSFLDACRLSTGRIAPDGTKQDYLYPPERVKKAIHLIRNPYHNFVARFHLERKNAVAKGKEDWLKVHPSDATGFQVWCQELDDMFKKEEYETFEHDMVTRLRDTPCHGEVFKFIQWHNLAFQLTEKLGIDTLVVFYEEYATNFNQTLDTILDFLELSQADTPRSFSAGHEYAEYYTSSDKRRIRVLAEEIASEVTWNHLERYFDKKSAFYDTDLSEDKKTPKKKHEGI
jgi:hypothetical protein